jgi:beta-glucanase (GH16 family)
MWCPNVKSRCNGTDDTGESIRQRPPTLLKTPRRVAVTAAITVIASSALAAGVGAAAVPRGAVVHNGACVSGLSSRQLRRELMVTLQRDLQRRYRPAIRARVFRRLAAHPAVAYRLIERWSPARFHAITCGSANRRPRHATTPGPVSLTSVQTGTAAGPAGIPGTWRLAWSDDFSGPALDTSKWSTGWFGSGVTPPVNSQEQDCYDPSQVNTAGGNLNLTAIAKAQTVNGRSFPYTSGIVTTMGKFTFTHGAVEARINLSGTNGKIDNWPAFWADGTGTWPMTGELDVMEGLGGYAAYHFHSLSGGPGADVSGNYTGWHTYAADWQPGVVTYYYDGHAVGQITTGITSNPMYLILNDAVGGQGGQAVAPSTMQVDYVRVWQ